MLLQPGAGAGTGNWKFERERCSPSAHLPQEAGLVMDLIGMISAQLWGSSSDTVTQLHRARRATYHGVDIVAAVKGKPILWEMATPPALRIVSDPCALRNPTIARCLNVCS